MGKRVQLLRKIQLDLLDLVLHTTDPPRTIAALEALLVEIEEVIGDPFDLTDDE